VGDAKRFGGELFGALFRGQVYELYRDACSEPRAAGARFADHVVLERIAGADRRSGFGR
jgi:hypothetical protein